MRRISSLDLESGEQVPQRRRPLRRLWICIFLCATLAPGYEGLLQRGLSAWTEGRLQEALEEFSRHTGGRKTDPLARLNIGIASGELLLDRLREIRSRVPSPAPADSSIGGDSLAVLADLEELERLVEEGGCREGLRRSAGLLGELAVAHDDFETLGDYHSGRFLLAAGDSAAGLAALGRCWETGDAEQYMVNLLLRALLARGKIFAAGELARSVLDRRHDNSVAWWALGLSLREEGRPAEALRAWSQGVAVYPLQEMLEDGIELAGGQDRPSLSNSWLKLLAVRYSHLYQPDALRRFCEDRGLELPVGLDNGEHGAERYGRRFPEFFPAGREWVYHVRYGFIPLGKLVVGVRDSELHRVPGQDPVEAHRVYYRIDSNPLYKLLIDLHDVYEALIPSHCLHSLQFVTHSREGRDRFDRVYEFDFLRGRLLARGYHLMGDIYRMNLPVAQELFDGLSLLFAARRQVLEGSFGPVLTIIDEEVHRTVIEDDGRGRKRIMGRTHPVRKVHGSADYQGIAGLTGEFWGSFSDDGEALPLSARFQIKVGRISLELEEIRHVN